MAGMAYTYEVLHNGPRELVFTAIGIDATTTVAFTSESAVTGIIAAAMTATSNTYTPTVHNKLRRLLYSTTNCAIRLQWHQTTNADLLTVGGSASWGDWDANKLFAGSQGLFCPNGAGASGDIDMITIPIAAVTSGSSVVTAAASLMFYIAKGTGTAAG